MTFRPATLADVPAIVELVHAAYRGDSSRAGWTTEADLLAGSRTDPDMVAEAITGPAEMVLLAADGTACCHLRRHDGYAYFGMFAVSPGQQGAGRGRALLEAAERVAREEWGADEMRMTVIIQREDLIEWYLRRGYVRTGEITPFPYDDARFGIPLRDDLAFETLSRKLT